MEESSDSEGEEVLELPKNLVMGTNNVKKARASVSAEVYGRFNAKNLFVPVVVNKSDAAKIKYVSTITIF
jgi:hypothetical protein